jgi:hypothetical protein
MATEASKIIIIITREYTRNLDGYKRDYYEMENEVIPEDYINKALYDAITQTLADEDFLQAMTETPLDEWENEDFREFLFNHCSIADDYSM